MHVNIDQQLLSSMIRTEADPHVARICADIEADARRIVSIQSRDTGALEAGLESGTDGRGNGVISVTRDVPGDDPKVPLYVEYGTENMDAEPFMRPALFVERG